MSWFVMLRHQNGRPVLMTRGEDLNDGAWDAMLFDTEEEAEDAAERNGLGKAFGWSVYEW